MAKSLWRLTGEVTKYAQARPSHPKEIVKTAKAFLSEEYKGGFYQALDVGCGSGISTANLFGEFQSVTGLDASQAMVDQARKQALHGSVTFMQSSAESLPVQDSSVQLVLVGRAIHYFDTEKFYKEVDRVLVTKGVLAFYSVHFPSISSCVSSVYGERINSIFWSYLTGRLAGYWPVNQYNGHTVDWRRRDYYVNKLAPPFPQKRVDESIHSNRSINILKLARELETYSSFVILREREGVEYGDALLQEFIDECKKVEAEEKEKEEQDLSELIATDNFFVVMSRKP